MTRLRYLPILLGAILLATLSGRAIAQTERVECTDNESWVPLGMGTTDEARLAVVADGNLYVLHTGPLTGGPTNEREEFQISKWDGTAWSSVVKNISMRGSYPYDFAVYNGEFYISGYFAQVNNIPGTVRLTRWTGTEWTAVGDSPLDESVSSIEVYNGELWTAGSRHGQKNALAKWNGTSWTMIDDNINSGISTLYAWKGSLYAGGSFTHIAGVDAPGIAKWDGATWTGMGSGMKIDAEQIIGVGNDLYAYRGWSLRRTDRQEIVRWDGTAWVAIPNMDKALVSSGKFAEHNGELYASVMVDSTVENGKFIDGGHAIYRWNGTEWRGVSRFESMPLFLVDYNAELIAGGYFTSSCGTALPHIARLCNAADCGRITGTIFRDENGDCVKDAGEQGLPRIIEILPGPLYVTSRADGTYSTALPRGAYTMNLAPYLHWHQSCPPTGGHAIDLTTPGGKTQGLDFAMNPDPNVQDLRVSIVAAIARPGRVLPYAITYSNAGTIETAGTIRVRLAPGLLYQGGAEPAPTRVTGDLLEWDFTGLKMEESRTITLHVMVSTELTEGMIICSEATADPLEVDAVRGDNRDSTCTEVRASRDPNNIVVIPEGNEGNGVIRQTDSVLTYTVNFQNTGSDTAFKVVVIDSLSRHLEVKSVMPGAASHPFTFDVSGNGVLTWTFDNIMLPDSHASEPKSHGFFKYTVRLKPALPSGSMITNRVDIYFDYNAAVATNTVVSVIAAPAGVPMPAARSAIAVYPNPTSGTLRLRADMAPGALVALQNVLGQTVRTYRYDGTGEMTIDASGLMAGTYLVAAQTRDGLVMERVTIVR